MSGYRFVGTVPDTLANGQPVCLGDLVDLTFLEAQAEHNRRMILERKLIPIVSKKPAAKKAVKKESEAAE